MISVLVEAGAPVNHGDLKGPIPLLAAITCEESERTWVERVRELLVHKGAVVTTELNAAIAQSNYRYRPVGDGVVDTP